MIDLNVKEMKENFERIPRHIKYQRKLIHEVETMHYSLFLGLTNLDLMQKDESFLDGKTFDSRLNKQFLEPPKI